MPTPINELNRLIIDCRPRPNHDSAYLPLVIDDTSNGPQASLMAGPIFDFLAPYRIMQALCDDRAQRTVDHQLLINGQPITPERYLKIWRSALTQPLSLRALGDQFGLRLLVHMQGAPEIPDHWRSPYQDAPFPNFSTFINHYREQIVETDGLLHLALDLRQPDALHHLWSADTMIPSKYATPPPTWKAWISVEPLSIPAMSQVA